VVEVIFFSKIGFMQFLEHLESGEVNLMSEFRIGLNCWGFKYYSK
jgi:hypothetical protein